MLELEQLFVPLLPVALAARVLVCSITLVGQHVCNVHSLQTADNHCAPEVGLSHDLLVPLSRKKVPAL